MRDACFINNTQVLKTQQEKNLKTHIAVNQIEKNNIQICKSINLQDILTEQEATKFSHF